MKRIHVATHQDCPDGWHVGAYINADDKSWEGYHWCRNVDGRAIIAVMRPDYEVIDGGDLAEAIDELLDEEDREESDDTSEEIVDEAWDDRQSME